MSNVVYLSTHPRFPVSSATEKRDFPLGALWGSLSTEQRAAMEKSDADELTIQNAPSVGKALHEYAKRHEAHGEVLLLLRNEAESLKDEAFRARALGQESVGKLKEETAKYLLSLVASLPTKLRGQ